MIINNIELTISKKNIIDDYKRLNEKCDYIITRIKIRKEKKLNDRQNC